MNAFEQLVALEDALEMTVAKLRDLGLGKPEIDAEVEAQRLNPDPNASEAAHLALWLVELGHLLDEVERLQSEGVNIDTEEEAPY